MIRNRISLEQLVNTVGGDKFDAKTPNKSQNITNVLMTIDTVTDFDPVPNPEFHPDLMLSSAYRQSIKSNLDHNVGIL